MNCFFEYQAVKNSAEKDFVKFTEEVLEVTSHLRYDYLSDEGKRELEFILMFLHIKYGVKRIYLLAHIGSILMIYFSPSEIFKIFMSLIERTAL